MVQSSPREAKLSDLEREIAAEIQKSRDPPRAFAMSPQVDAPTLAMSDDVESRGGATEIGRLSVEGMGREYEVAAKEIEAMGAEIIESAKQCEAMAHDALAVTEELKEIAARYREEAKRVFAEIESRSQATADIRKTCTELKEKIRSSGHDRQVKTKK